MKRGFFHLISLGGCVFLGLYLAIYFQKFQSDTYEKIKINFHNIENKLNELEDDLLFLKHNDKKIIFLIKKGWFVPQNRLISGEQINKSANHLNSVHFTIDPESLKEIDDKIRFKVSNVTVNVGGLLDQDVYDFVENILTNFPGILRLRKLSLQKREKVNKVNLLALKNQKRPNFVEAEIVLEWFSIASKKDE